MMSLDEIREEINKRLEAIAFVRKTIGYSGFSEDGDKKIEALNFVSECVTFADTVEEFIKIVDDANVDEVIKELAKGFIKHGLKLSEVKNLSAFCSEVEIIKGSAKKMTIKKIKEKYQNYRCSGNEKNKFVVYDWGFGKAVIVVNVSPNKLIGKYVTQVIRVSDGKELIKKGSSRPCDNLEDAIDVAGEMICDDLSCAGEPE